MSKKIRDTKVRTLIKAYLIFNRGKKCTAKQISEWINSERFSMNNVIVNPRLISYLISSGRYNPSHMLYDVECENRHNLNYYWVN